MRYFTHASEDPLEVTQHIQAFLTRAFRGSVAKTADPRVQTLVRASNLTGGGTASGAGGSGAGSGGGTGILGGDVTGSPLNNTVSLLQGFLLTLASMVTGQLLTWNGSAWVNSNVVNGQLAVNQSGAPTAGLTLGAGVAAASGAPLKLTSGTNLTTGEAGAVEYSGQRAFFTPSIYRRALSMSAGAIISTVTVANTVTPTTLRSVPISGTDMAAGQVFSLRLIGRYSTANGADTVTLNAQVAGVTVLSVTTTAGVVTNAPIDVEFIYTIRTTGVGGTAIAHLRAEINGAIKTVTATATFAIDTTLERDVSFQAVWSNALAGNTLSAEQTYLDIRA
jgi:hypothetical protein